MATVWVMSGPRLVNVQTLDQDDLADMVCNYQYEGLMFLQGSQMAALMVEYDPFNNPDARECFMSELQYGCLPRWDENLKSAERWGF